MSELFDLSQYIEKTFGFRPNRNQCSDLTRLFFEILKREDISLDRLLEQLRRNTDCRRVSGRDRFFLIKRALIARRFPIASSQEALALGDVFLPKVRPASGANPRIPGQFEAQKIFVEPGLLRSALFRRFNAAFPAAQIEEIEHHSLYAKKNKFDLGQLKQPLVFIVKESWDYIKPCPCTPGHISCGYWILNLGFGCPFDCSYCFLQQYANFPGLILPANLEDFFDRFSKFEKKLDMPIRIGTGEFCDSLALDEITQYSRQLIPYFSTKKVLFEFKTKSDKIGNILSMPASSNIVVSWSLNPPSIVETEELGTAGLHARLSAAAEVQKKGFSVGFHFDPVIYSSDWREKYQEVIDLLYTRLKPPFAWISIGTLRGNRELKVASEARFPRSAIFYGELLLGKDKKLRYPAGMRKEIHRIMREMIRAKDEKTPVYLCMEDKESWKALGRSEPADIARYLLGR